MKFKMNINIKNKKTAIIIAIGLVIIIGVIIFLLLNKDNLFNKNKKMIINDKPVVEKIEISNNINEITVIDARIEKLGNISNIFIKIKNNTNGAIDKSDLKLTIYDKDNNAILVSNINNVDKFKVGEEREIQVATSNDITTAVKYVVEKVNNSW